MIFGLLTDGQWFVVWTLVLIVSVVVWSWIFWDVPRGKFDPHPITLGILLGVLTPMVLAGLLALVHGLTWMWIYG